MTADLQRGARRRISTAGSFRQDVPDGAPDHPRHVRALSTLAKLDFEHGRYAEAQPLYRP